jgi:hypothetical protein
MLAVGGLEALRAWLHAELFLTNFRPTPLTEHAVFRGKVYEKIPPQARSTAARPAAAAQPACPSPTCPAMEALLPGPAPTPFNLVPASLHPLSGCPQELKQLGEGQPPLREVREVAPSDPRRDADRLVPLVAEAAAEGHPVLVFCSSRKQCESAAALIAELLPQVGRAAVTGWPGCWTGSWVPWLLPVAAGCKPAFLSLLRTCAPARLGSTPPPAPAALPAGRPAAGRPPGAAG